MSGHAVARPGSPDGLLVVEDLEPGLHTVSILSRDHAPQRVTATATADPEPVRVVLSAASLLELSILDAGGNPVSYPGISIVDADGWDLADAAYEWGFVDEQVGKYRYRLARGRYTIRVEAEGYAAGQEQVETPVPGGGIEIVLRKE